MDQDQAAKFLQAYWDSTLVNGQNLPVSGGLVSKERLAAIQDGQHLRNDDVLVVAYPKSGIHWVMDIATKLLLDGDLEQANKWARPFLEVQFPTAVPDGQHAQANTLEEIEALPSPRVIASHLWYENIPQQAKENNTKIIYVWRNIKDTLGSRYDMMKKLFPPHLLPDMDKAIEQFLKPTSPFGNWMDHVKSYQKQDSNNNVLIVSYDGMKQELMPWILKIAQFLGKSPTEDELNRICGSCSIEATKISTPHSVFVGQGISGRWKSYLTEAQSKNIDDALEKDGMSSGTF